MSSQLMVKEKEVRKLTEDNRLLVKQFRDKKERRREAIAQVRNLLYSHITTNMVVVTYCIHM